MKPTERRRLRKLLATECQEREAGYQSIAGIDEAGRGPLAGPVVAAACIFTEECLIEGVNDSKQLTPQQREGIYERLVAHPHVRFAIGVIDSLEIDRINIYQATIQAMLQAVAALAHLPDLLLVDGLALPHPTIPARKIIGGDGLCYSIAAASILAKVHRDRLMVQYHQQWPQYGFDRHKGYATEEHREILAKVGACPIHRRSFDPVPAHDCQPALC